MSENNFGHPNQIDNVPFVILKPLKQYSHLDYDQPTAFQIRYQGKLKRVFAEGMGKYYIRVEGKVPNALFSKYSAMISIADKTAIETINSYYKMPEKGDE